MATGPGGPFKVRESFARAVFATQSGAACHLDPARQTITTKTPRNGVYCHRIFTAAWYVQASLYIGKGPCGALRGEQNGIPQPYRIAADPSAQVHPPSASGCRGATGCNAPSQQCRKS